VIVRREEIGDVLGMRLGFGARQKAGANPYSTSTAGEEIAYALWCTDSACRDDRD
jgi:hypothetical protein